MNLLLPETPLALFSLLNLLELMLKPTESYGSSSGAGSLLQSGLLATLCMPVLACVVMAEALELPMVALPGKRRNKQRMQLPGVVAALLLGGQEGLFTLGGGGCSVEGEAGAGGCCGCGMFFSNQYERETNV